MDLKKIIIIGLSFLLITFFFNKKIPLLYAQIYYDDCILIPGCTDFPDGCCTNHCGPLETPFPNPYCEAFYNADCTVVVIPTPYSCLSITVTPTPSPTPTCVPFGDPCIYDSDCCTNNCDVTGNCGRAATPTPSTSPTNTPGGPTNTPGPSSTPAPTIPPLRPIDWTSHFQTVFPNAGNIQINEVLTLGNIINALLDYILPLTGILLLLFLIYGGFQYMTSGGDPRKAEMARRVITYAIIGFIIVFLAFWIVQIVSKILGIPQVDISTGTGG
ncbi:hypothetical protein A2Z22_02820 [Candidatus Woesebacteria bacterium RBG_16_34_12]|uniref:Uncharacterized protein n=1 Tax=Candidatus Woesebacteria bacterium RBG_16_34_12 TaxID=1802480 RepID=A0A1F7X6S7_9BACT|nr:MAG: hypothetical protein A2Z22_02820 [Candidatus Woesebacteria bacterium RBG_16_34_12]